MGPEDIAANYKSQLSIIREKEKVNLIDTHCHLEMEDFDSDREDVIKRANDAGLEALITVSSSLDSSLKNIKLSGQYDFIYSSVGIHPHDAVVFSEELHSRLEELSGNKKVVAIGETGLDYHYDHSPRNVQKNVFEKHLDLAEKTGLPVIVHSREAMEDTLDILKKSGISKGVLHCFSGNMKMAKQAMSMGFYISIAGPVTFKKAIHLKEIVRTIPDDYLLIESDAPYLSPEPYRGRRNEPAFILNTVKYIAELRGVSLEDAARITTLNAKRLFGIGDLSEKAEIAYQIRDSLYLNITNRCSNKCTFCVKFHTEYVKGHRLRLTNEPTEEEIKKEIDNPAKFKEVVFCGYGEPLQRLETVKSIAKWIKEKGGIVRINTNGQANLIHNRDITPELKGIADSISISLDAHDEATYNKICRPLYKNAFSEVIRFIKQAKQVIPEVQITVVDLETVDLNKCKEISENLGVKFKIRKLDVVG